MRRFMSLLVATSLITLAPIASAHPAGSYYEPAGTASFTGTALVQKGTAVQLNCVVTVNLSGPNDAGDGLASSHTHFHHASATVTFSAGDAACPTISANPVPVGNVAYNELTGKISFTDLFVNTLTIGNCAGTIEGDYLAGGIYLNGVVLPEVLTGSGDCTVTVFLAGTTGTSFHGSH